MKRVVLLALCSMALGSLAWSQAPLVDDDFTNNPCCTRADFDSGICDKDWICQGNTVWIPPDADECDLDLDDDGTVDANVFDQFTSFDPANPCTQFPGEGYVLVTPAITGQAGNMFRKEPVEYDNFKLTAEVELRDGSIGRPADGMCIVIVGTADPPALGSAGGAMGSTGLGTVPTMIFEFDNWSCNTGDNNDQNHVQFAWSPVGFSGADAAQIKPLPLQGVFTKVNESLYPLNNRQPPPAESNRFLFEVIVQGGTVACYLSNDDAGLTRTRFFTFPIKDFQKFSGYLGVTGSTGGAWQNQIIHSIKIEPFAGCLAPPAIVTRDLQSTRAADEFSGDYLPGDQVTVLNTLSDIRLAGANCVAAASIKINDVLPTGWTAGTISDGGTYDAGTNTVTWVLTGASFVNGKSVSYKATAPDNTDLSSVWSGNYAENIALSESSGISGEDTLYKVGDFDTCGGIRAWNLLGAYLQGPGGGAGPGDDLIRLDYMTDGDKTELDYVWFPGATIATAFNGDGISESFSTGLTGTKEGINPGGIPTVLAWNDLDGYINLNDDVYAGDPNNCMAYAQAYVFNDTGADLDVFIGSASDDSIQIILNEQEAWIHSIPRGGADACAPQDISPDGTIFTEPHTLFKGKNSLIVKTFEGGGGFNFACRFQNDLGEPITEGLRISKYPGDICVKPPYVSATRSLSTGKTVSIQGGTFPGWDLGDTYSVGVALSGIRANPSGCTAPTSVTVREIVPTGWTPSAANLGGTVAGNLVTWVLTGANLTNAVSLTYSVTTGGALGTVNFSGSYLDTGATVTYATGGPSTLYHPTDYSRSGFIQEWLLLGPYKQPGLLNLDAPGEDKMRLDHITDNKGITEASVRPKAGDTVATAYGPGAGKARSTGLQTGATTAINPDGVPTWSAWQDADDLVAFENYYGADLDRLMMLAGTYICVDEDINVDLGLASDDSIQVLLDGEEIFIHNIARGSGLVDEVQDVVCGTIGGTCANTLDVGQLAPLSKGVHFLLVKVFEGGGGHNFRLRFQDPVTGEPITSGITIGLDPDATCGGPPPGKLLHRGDADDNGVLQLTDAIRILGFLFLGGTEPTCLDAADADDNGVLQLTDAIRILGFLFLGGAPPASPGPPPDACGVDAGEELGCTSYTKC